MSNVGQRERVTKDRVVNFFQKELGCDYLMIGKNVIITAISNLNIYVLIEA
jgi:hypothetical protein